MIFNMINIFSSLLIALLVLLITAYGQEIDSEICSCSPSSYEFKLDFSMTCPPVNITVGQAIEATSCLISPFGNPNVQDLIPVAIESIDVLELGQSLRVIAQTRIGNILRDGDSFVYQSAFANPDDVFSSEEVVRALQMNLVGINAAGDRVINVFIVTFTNECSSYPIFERGESAGWVELVDFGETSSELCTAATETPKEISTLGPTEASAVNYTDTLSEKTTLSPTSYPEAFPTDAPEAKPTESPTKAPITSDPTSTPTQESILTEVPTLTLTGGMNVPTNTHQLETGSLAPATSTPNPVQITENPLGDIAMDVETANEDSSVGVKPPMTPSESFPEDIDVAASMSMSMSMSMNRFLEDSTNREVSVWTPLSDKRGDTFRVEGDNERPYFD